jgi:hypothetical protein
MASRTPASLSSQDSLARARSGDEQAYLVLSQRLLPGVHSFAFALLGEAALASRIARDALLFPLSSLQEIRSESDFRTRVYRQAARLIARERVSVAPIGADSPGANTQGLMVDHLVGVVGLQPAELARVLSISRPGAGIVVRRARPPLTLAPLDVPADLAPAFSLALASHWPDRQPRGAVRLRAAPLPANHRLRSIAMATICLALLGSISAIGWTLLRSDAGELAAVAPAGFESLPQTAESGLFPAVTRAPPTALPSPTSTRAPAATPTSSATASPATVPAAGAATPSPAPTSIATPAPTAAASPTAGPSSTPVPAPTSTATAQPCAPRLAANVSSVTLVPGTPSFFYVLNQAQCGSLPFAVSSNATWLTATATTAVIANSALVAVNLLADGALLPGTGEGAFVTTVSLTGTDGGGAASVQVSVIQAGSGPSILSVSAFCSGGQVNFSLAASDDFGVTSATVRASISSGPVTSSMALTSGTARSGTWGASVARPAEVQGWAVTVTDGAGVTRSSVVTPAGCS